MDCPDPRTGGTALRTPYSVARPRSGAVYRYRQDLKVQNAKTRDPVVPTIGLAKPDDNRSLRQWQGGIRGSGDWSPSRLPNPSPRREGSSKKAVSRWTPVSWRMVSRKDSRGDNTGIQSLTAIVSEW